MPIIKIDYDDCVIQEDTIKLLSKAVQKIVIDHTNINEVMVYANTAQIKIDVDPIEIFIEMSAKINDAHPNLTHAIKADIIKWKSDNNFTTPINLTIIPMQWHMEIGI